MSSTPCPTSTRLPARHPRKADRRATERYGREHAALVASFSTYRSRGAIRDLGKALGLPFAELERLARVTEGSPKRVAEEIANLPDGDAKLSRAAGGPSACTSREIAGLPRHISQHPGGMVISSRPLVELVPVQPAAMEGARSASGTRTPAPMQGS